MADTPGGITIIPVRGGMYLGEDPLIQADGNMGNGQVGSIRGPVAGAVAAGELKAAGRGYLASAATAASCQLDRLSHACEACQETRRAF